MMKGKGKEAKMAVLKDLIDMMRGEEKKSWKDVVGEKKAESEMPEGEEEEDDKEEEDGGCSECKDGSCPECKKKGGLAIIIGVGKPKKEG